MDSDASKFSRRAVLSGLLFSALATKQSASALTPEEAEEYARLQKEAQRVQAVFDANKFDSAVLPSLKDKPASEVNEKMVAGPTPSPFMAPEEVVSVLMQTMKDNEQLGDDSGLSAVLSFASNKNPIKRIPSDLFFAELKNSKYSILTSDYYTARVSAPQVLSEPSATEEVRRYFVSIEAPLPLLKSCSVPDQCIAPIASTSSGAARPKDSYAVTFRWQLSKDSNTKCWMYDACELMSSASSAVSVPASSVKEA